MLLTVCHVCVQLTSKVIVLETQSKAVVQVDNEDLRKVGTLGHQRKAAPVTDHPSLKTTLGDFLIIYLNFVGGTLPVRKLKSVICKASKFYCSKYCQQSWY